MKKVIFYSALVVLLAGSLLTCDTGEDECENISGFYVVSKTMSSLTCKKAGKTIKIQNSDRILPNNSNLTINQSSCDLVATEEITADNVRIPYTGSVDADADFNLQTQNPDQLALPLTLEIAGVKHKCRFNGAILWEGKQDSNGLSGQINYDLDKRKDETDAACPNSCTLTADFSTIR